MRISTVKDVPNIVLFLGIIVLFSTASIVATNFAFMITDKIYNGVMVGDIAVGGLTVKEAENKILSSVQRRLSDSPIIVKYEGASWAISSQDIDFTVDSAKLAEQAFNVGRSGGVFRQFKERYITINGGYNVPIIPSYNTDKLKAILGKVSREINSEPHNAQVLIDGARIIKLPESNGRKVDVEQFVLSINENLSDSFPVIIDIPVIIVEPEVKYNDINDIDSILAIYTTQFNPYNENRTQNIKLASDSINGTLLKSGEVLSFNDLVGLRIAEAGYKEAPVFVEGKIVPDLGGGVCQVSSTLYNAALLADMNIIERTPHFRPPGYVPLGQDATVADKLLDFKFKNNSPHNVYIISQVGGGNITIIILGNDNAERPEITIEAMDKKVIEPNTIVKQDPSLEYGRQVIESQGQKGFMISTYRVKRVNGKEIARENLSTDEFKPEDRIVRVGTRVSSPNTIK